MSERSEFPNFSRNVKITSLIMRGGQRELEGEGRKLRVSKRKPQVFSRDVNSLPLPRKKRFEEERIGLCYVKDIYLSFLLFLKVFHLQ